MKKIIVLFLMSSFFLQAQIIDCRFVVNADFVNQTNQQVFETLEQSLNEFINAKAWTDETVDTKEKSALQYGPQFNGIQRVAL